jgi:UDP-N-acetylmuramate dehydrogenase
LNKVPVFNTSYGTIREELDKMGVKELGISAISKAVINIRSSKLPDPAKIGNAGSFFKNPVVSNAIFASLKNEFPDIVGYKNGNEEMKLAAGWLVEKCGWKGFREYDYGVHKQQALVLVNYGNAKGTAIYELSARIIESVQKKFGLALEREVNVI